MSRTCRKPKFLIEETLVQHLNKTIDRYSHRKFYSAPVGTKSVRVRKTKEEYDAEVLAENARYKKDFEKYRKSPLFNDAPNKYFYYVWKFKRVEVPFSLEDEIKEETHEYKKRTRDGYWNESGRNTYYKELSAKEIRVATRKLLNDIMKEDENYDQKPYPDSYLGKKHLWSVW